MPANLRAAQAAAHAITVEVLARLEPERNAGEFWAVFEIVLRGIESFSEPRTEPPDQGGTRAHG